MYGIIYTNKEEEYQLREQIKKDIVEEYNKNKEPSSDFINSFAEKYKLCMPSDTLFDFSGLFDIFTELF
jgi:RNase adaptor protein for sRNA GlmZ degradation